MRPTSLEEDFIRLCEEHGLPFMYVGDGTIWIERKNPDFIHKEKGKRICVEVSNRVNRDEESYAKPRKKAFRKNGWKCLIFFGNSKLEKADSEIVKEIKRALGKSISEPLSGVGIMPKRRERVVISTKIPKRLEKIIEDCLKEDTHMSKGEFYRDAIRLMVKEHYPLVYNRYFGIADVEK